MAGGVAGLLSAHIWWYWISVITVSGTPLSIFAPVTEFKTWDITLPTTIFGSQSEGVIINWWVPFGGILVVIGELLLQGVISSKLKVIGPPVQPVSIKVLIAISKSKTIGVEGIVWYVVPW